jgi:hypothetical protein
MHNYECYDAAARSSRCLFFNIFSVFINSRMPTGIPPNRSSCAPGGLIPEPQFVSLPPPSSSMLVATCEGVPGCADMVPVPSGTFFGDLFLFSFCCCCNNFSRACADLAAHSSKSSRKRSHTQFAHPLMQQLSGSCGRGGTSTPAIRVLCSFINLRLSIGPANLLPKTSRALARRSSCSVLGSSVGGDGVAGVRVADAVTCKGWERSSA